MDPSTLYPNPNMQNTPVAPYQAPAGASAVDPSMMAQTPIVMPAQPGNGGPLQAPLPGQPQNQATHIHSNPNSSQNSLEIAEIRDGLVIINDGSFRSVVMVKSINFDLMSTSEQEGVEFTYQRFLNSLVWPIQIFIRSERIDLRPYINKLDRIRVQHDNMLLAMLMDDYINFIDNISQQANIMNKRFYVVVPYFPVINIEKAFEQSKNLFKGVGKLFSKKEHHVTVNETELETAKNELRNRVQTVLAGLQQCGIQGLPLDTQELIELYYDTYNPDTATRQQLKNFNDLSADVVTKGEGFAPQTHLQQELQ
jgi:hypothetical protein